MIKKSKFIIYGFLFISVLSGCGETNYFESIADKDSDVAKQEQGRIQIDQGDYKGAIASLEASCATDEAKTAGSKECSTLATAYMGLAGLDVIEVMKKIDAVTKEGGAQNFNMSTIYSVIPESTGEQGKENISNMAKAMDILSQKTDRTTDEELQLGMAAATSLVITVGQVAGGFNKETGLPNETNPLVLLASLTKPASSIGIDKNTSIGESMLSSTDMVAKSIAMTALTATDSAAKTGTNTGLNNDNLNQIAAIKTDIASKSTASTPEEKQEEKTSPGGITNNDIISYISTLNMTK